MAKLFADAGLICIASLISPYRRDRDSCRAILPDASFIEVWPVFHLQSILLSFLFFHSHDLIYSFIITILKQRQVFLNMPLEVCESRDPKGLYKLARAGKIKGLSYSQSVYILWRALEQGFLYLF